MPAHLSSADLTRLGATPQRRAQLRSIQARGERLVRELYVDSLTPCREIQIEAQLLALEEERYAPRLAPTQPRPRPQRAAA